MGLREIAFRRGPPPAPPFRPPPDEPESGPSTAAPPPSPSSMPRPAAPAAVADRGAAPATPTPAIDAAPPPPEGPGTAAVGRGAGLHAESVEIRELRARFERVRKQAGEERERVPLLGRAVATARTSAREREVARVLDPGPESQAAAEEARSLLEKAISEESDTLRSVELLRIAEERAGTALSAAIEQAAHDDERAVLRVLDASAAKDADDLRAVLVRLFLRARLRGLTTHAQALVSATLGLAASGEAMLQKSGELYRQILKESKP